MKLPDSAAASTAVRIASGGEVLGDVSGGAGFQRHRGRMLLGARGRARRCRCSASLGAALLIIVGPVGSPEAVRSPARRPRRRSFRLPCASRSPRASRPLPRSRNRSRSIRATPIRVTAWPSTMRHRRSSLKSSQNPFKGLEVGSPRWHSRPYPLRLNRNPRCALGARFIWLGRSWQASSRGAEAPPHVQSS